MVGRHRQDLKLELFLYWIVASITVERVQCAGTGVAISTAVTLCPIPPLKRFERLTPGIWRETESGHRDLDLP